MHDDHPQHAPAPLSLRQMAASRPPASGVKTTRPWYSFALWLVAGPIAAQTVPHQEPPVAEATSEAEPDLDSVLADLARAHGGDDASRAAKSFQGKLSITPTAKKADKITVVLDARFQAPELIRYRVDEGETRVERGRDKDGPWVRLDDEAVSLMGRDGEGDRKQLEKHIGLARQLLSYLDPARVARQLDDPVLVEEPLVISPSKQVPCFSITGVTDEFPLYFRGGESGKVQLKLWIDANTHLLIGVEAFPFDEKGHLAPLGEFIYMPQHGNRSGIQLPVVLVFDQIDRMGRHLPSAKVELIQLELEPGFADDEFSRKHPW